MPASFNYLSGSTNGKAINLATAVSTIHTTATAGKDLVFLQAANTSTGASLAISVYMGATGANDDITMTLPSDDGLYTIVNGLPLGSGNIVKASAASGTSVNVYGWVTRVT